MNNDPELAAVLAASMENQGGNNNANLRRALAESLGQAPANPGAHAAPMGAHGAPVQGAPMGAANGNLERALALSMQQHNENQNENLREVLEQTRLVDNLNQAVDRIWDGYLEADELHRRGFRLSLQLDDYIYAIDNRVGGRAGANGASAAEAEAILHMFEEQLAHSGTPFMTHEAHIDEITPVIERAEAFFEEHHEVGIFPTLDLLLHRMEVYEAEQAELRQIAEMEAAEEEAARVRREAEAEATRVREEAEAAAALAARAVTGRQAMLEAARRRQAALLAAAAGSSASSGAAGSSSAPGSSANVVHRPNGNGKRKSRKGRKGAKTRKGRKQMRRSRRH